MMDCKKIEYKMSVRKFPFILLITLIYLFTSCKYSSNDSKIVFGKGGNTKVIIVPENAGEVINFAALELQDYLKKITGIRAKIISDGTDHKDIKAIRFSLDKNAKLKWDGFNIKTDVGGVTISAKEPRGLLYGAYQLLEDVGCSFVYLNEQEEIIPNLPTLEFPKGDKVFNPVIEHRGLAPYGLQASSVELGRNFISWMAKNKLNYILVSENRPSDSPGSAHGSIWKEVTNELLPELQKRGFTIEMSEHCTNIFFPRSLHNEHPDWFALNDGERKLGPPPYSGQICYSNQDAIEYYATSLANYAKEHPEFHTIGTWPLDGGEYCECEACKDPLTVFNAAKYVAEKVKKVSPGMIVGHLAYQPMSWQPPKTEKIPDNMSVLWCPDNGKMTDMAKEWIQKSEQAGGVYQFEYYLGDNYRASSNVWLNPYFAAESVNYAHKIGYRGIISLFLPMETWWRSCFNYWFFAKACWSPNLDINSCLHSYCMNYYGDHGNTIEIIFKDIFAELQKEPFISVFKKAYKDRSETITPIAMDITKQLDALIDSTKEPIIISRLKRLKVYVEYFQLYYQTISEFDNLYTENPADFEKYSLSRLENFSKNHHEQHMVLMNPEYIRWRLMDLYKYERQ